MSLFDHPAALPAAIQSEITRLRSYLDGLEQRVVAFGHSLSDPTEAIAWAADVHQSLRETPSVLNGDGSFGFGSAARLDRLTVALVFHAAGISGPLPFSITGQE